MILHYYSSKIAVHILLTLHIVQSLLVELRWHGGPYFSCEGPYFTGRMHGDPGSPIADSQAGRLAARALYRRLRMVRVRMCVGMAHGVAL